MKQAQRRIVVNTSGAGLFEITDLVRRWVSEQSVPTGLLTVFCCHTSASLLIQENADPDVHTDLLTFFSDLAPRMREWVHQTEGPDDMPAHVRSALTQSSLSIPIATGRLALGRWQGIYLFEHRDAPHRREIMLHIIGE